MLSLALVLALCSLPPATDAAQLLQLHAQVLDGHIRRDAEVWLASEQDDYVVANRGQISKPTKAERRASFGPYLKSTRFTEYRDLQPPIVRVSTDGTLGWVIAQVFVRGEQTGPDGKTAPFEVTWAWIELYEKRNGVWVRIGNLSNRKE